MSQHKRKFDQVYESLIGQVAYKDAILKDVQIGDVYIMLKKSGNSFKVDVGKGGTIVKAKFRTVFTTTSEEAARNRFYKERNKEIEKVGV